MPLLRVFLDTEFTDMRHPTLISVGLAAANGSEFYVELTDGWQPDQCSDFVHDEVLPRFYGSPAVQITRAELKPRLIAWLESLAPAPCAVRIEFDSEVDWRLLRDACGNLNTRDLDVQWQWLQWPDKTQGQHCQEILENLLHDHPQRHHALTDARALRDAVLATEAQAKPG